MTNERKTAMKNFKNVITVTWAVICCAGYWVYDNFIAEMPEDHV